MKVKVKSLSHVWLFATPWTVACQASLSFTTSQSLFVIKLYTQTLVSIYSLLVQDTQFPIPVGVSLTSLNTPNPTPTNTLRKTLLLFFLPSFWQSSCLICSHCISGSILSSPVLHIPAIGGRTKCMCRLGIWPTSPALCDILFHRKHAILCLNLLQQSRNAHPSRFTSDLTSTHVQTWTLLL